MPVTMYHRTTPQAADAILREGFKGRPEGSRFYDHEVPFVYFSNIPIDSGVRPCALLEVTMDVDADLLSLFEETTDFHGEREWRIPEHFINGLGTVRRLSQEEEEDLLLEISGRLTHVHLVGMGGITVAITHRPAPEPRLTRDYMRSMDEVFAPSRAPIEWSPGAGPIATSDFQTSDPAWTHPIDQSPKERSRIEDCSPIRLLIGSDSDANQGASVGSIEKRSAGRIAT